MTDTTPRSRMPLLAAAQAQKHVTHNEALVQLDALLYARILDRDLTAPPSSPADGDTWLVKATATGAWTGQSGKLAAALDGAWRFYPPFTGLSLYVADEQKLIVFDGSAWQDYAAILTLQNVPLLGVNTTADTTNRLAVKSAALLFDNTGAGIQAKLNKHATADTASLLFQTNYSARAEFGLCNDDDFHLKVSPDGSAWTDALHISAASGAIGIGATSPLAQLHINSATSAAPTATLAGTASSTLAAFTAEAASGIAMACFSSTGRMVVSGVRGRGTFASPVAVQANDRLFSLLAAGYDGSALQNAASVEFLCDGAPSSGHVPTRISFLTGTTGSDRTERVTVTSTGLVGIGLTPAVQLDVAGPMRVGQYTVATVPSAAAGAGQMIYVSNESGGAVLAFSDGTNWRRVTDRAVIS